MTVTLLPSFDNQTARALPAIPAPTMRTLRGGEINKVRQISEGKGIEWVG